RSANPPMPSCKVDNPNSTSPNPARAAPAPDTRPRPRSLIIAPMKIIGSAADVSDTRTPMSATSQPVPVVPTFAPNTSPSPCGNVSRPALTRPIVIIVVALEDCTTRVSDAPEGAAQRRRRRLGEHGAQRGSGQSLQAGGHDGHSEQKKAYAPKD